MLSDNFELEVNQSSDLYANWQSEYEKYYMKNFGTPKLLITHGQDSFVYDSKGKEYIDLLGGIAVNSLGHQNEEIIKAISKGAHKLMHISNFFTTEPQIKLAKKIAELVGFEHKPRVLFTNSGTEAVECALKIAKKHAHNLGNENAKIIALNNSFHGRSLGALSVTSKSKFRAPFEPLLPNVSFIDANVKALEDEFANGSGKTANTSAKGSVSAVILECIQGEGGVISLDPKFIKKARQLCTKHKALLIIDEVQTGIARTGKWFSYQYHDIKPDIITLAKGLGGGFPIGATIALGKVADTLVAGDHGTTFGGNPLACEVALTVINEIENDRLLQNANSAFLNVKELVRSQNLGIIKEVRGEGLLIGIELKKKIASKVADRCLENGLIVNAVNETTIRLAPALNITPIVLYKGLRILFSSINEVLAA